MLNQVIHIIYCNHDDDISSTFYQQSLQTLLQVQWVLGHEDTQNKRMSYHMWDHLY